MTPPNPDLAVLQLKVTLRDSKPPIWRRIQVKNNITLYKLHQVLQVVMGWQNAHLHQFIISGTYYGQPHSDYGFEVRSERGAKLNQVAAHEKFKFLYEYDFGDSWQHEILIEKILPLNPEVRYPLCLKGKRACPPEDCGGIWGYEDLLGILHDPNHSNYEEMLEWIGGEFDPETFNVAEINRQLQSLR